MTAKTWSILDYQRVEDRLLGHIDFPKSDAVIAPAIAKHKVWEPNEVDWIINNVSNGMVCVNAGANVGYHSMIMSRAVGHSGKVYAYEPSSEVFHFLVKNISSKDMRNIVAIEKAVGGYNGEIILYLNDKNCGDNRCFNPQEVSDHYGTFIDHGFSENPRQEIVEVVTLDSQINEKVDLIFMDVQGFEFDVLIGSERILQNDRPTIFFEFIPDWYDQIGVDYHTEILRLQNQFKYKLSILKRDGTIPMKNIDEVVDYIRKNKMNSLYANIILEPSGT